MPAIRIGVVTAEAVFPGDLIPQHLGRSHCEISARMDGVKDLLLFEKPKFEHPIRNLRLFGIREYPVSRSERRVRNQVRTVAATVTGSRPLSRLLAVDTQHKNWMVHSAVLDGVVRFV